MEYQPNQQSQPIKRAKNYNDPKERERLLMQYAGIFKNSIKEYGETVMKKHKRQVNYAR